MLIFHRLFIILALACLLVGKSSAGSDKQDFYRNFWNPTYHGKRLNYCTLDGKKCGMQVASHYCQKMGYKNADKEIIDYNVGLTNYPMSNAYCKGWQCDGFMLIRCVGKITHKPPQKYYYRSRRFVFPRFDQYRVDWCYANGRNCGQRPAYSFCRRMGFMKAQGYKKQENVPATKALGNHQLCFGNQCTGYSEITCYR